MRLHKEKRAAVYVRCSTEAQTTDAQEAELREYAKHRGWALHKVYSDRGVSGAASTRPALDELMQDCRRRKVDIVLVWKFDRFARSLRQLVSALQEFRSLGIDFVSCTEAIDTSSPTGELVFHVFGAIAQFERSLVSERTKSALREARRNGKRLGRPPAAPLTPDQVKRLREEKKRGVLSLRAISRKCGVPLWRVHVFMHDRQASV